MMAWQGFAELYSETGERRHACTHLTHVSTKNRPCNVLAPAACCPAGQWSNATSAYSTLVGLASGSADDAVKTRGRQFLRKQADSAAKADNYQEAEACYRQLLSSATDGEANGPLSWR